ncbi:MAG TPA: ABC transporter substrate-binding protein, partial [Flavobacteriaceae bacterium]|nr:ABC transporter substrate-binding protein [Flavobacteriaceae bacterium]
MGVSTINSNFRGLKGEHSSMRFFLLILGFFGAFTVMAQSDADRWTGFFSYNSIKDVAYGDNKVFVAAENAVYSYDPWSEALSTITTIEGLSGESITEIHYSADYNLLMVGHDNGLIEIIPEGQDNVLQIVAILNKPSIPPNIKAINDFYEYQGQVYVSTDFGISVFDLNQMEFGDTYYIGALGSTISVAQTTILPPYIYAATAQNGIKQALLDGPDLIDYASWETVTGGGIVAIQTLNDAVYFARTNQRVLRLTPEPAQIMADFGSDPIVDMRVNDNVLTITTESTVNTYGADFTPLNVVELPFDLEDQFTVGLGIADQIFAGTNANGLLKQNSGQFQWSSIGPQGPLFNNPFSIDASGGQLWVGFGEVTVSFNPYPLSYRGLSQLQNDSWNNIPASELLGASDIVQMTINPMDPNQVFASSFQFGLLKLTAGVPEILYDQSNSSLTIPAGNPAAGLRIYGSDFDRDNNLWFVQSKIDQGLLRLSPSGQIGKIDLSGIINAEDELALTD